METYYSRHKEKVLERQKKYNQDHKDQIKQYQQQYWLTVKKAKVQATRQPKPKKPKTPKPKKVKPPVLPSPESIIESIKEPEPIIESNITYINKPIIVSFD
jgi:hypothetical protein